MSNLRLKINRPIRGVQQNTDAFNTAALGTLLTDKDLRFSVPAEGTRASESIKGFTQVLEQTRKNSYQAGYEAGYSTGRQEADTIARQLRQELQTLITGLEKHYRETLEDMREPLVKLARQLAAKVVGAIVSSNDNFEAILLHQVKQIISELNEEHQITVKVNPAGLANLNEQNFIEQLHLPSQVKVKIHPDSQVEPGGCIVETNEFLANGQVQQQLDQLETQLLQNDQEWKV